MSWESAQPPAMTLTEARARSAAEGVQDPWVQGALALDDRADEDARTLSHGCFFGPQPTPRRDLPDPHGWAGQVGQALIEAMAGCRAATQLARWVHPGPYAAVTAAHLASVRRLERTPEARRPRLRVHRVDVCEPADGVAEASLVIRDGPRMRAMALRLVGEDGRWRVAAIRIG